MRTASEWVPLLWQEPFNLDLLQGTPINCVVVSPGAVDKLAAARTAGLDVVTTGELPEALTIRNRPWPRVKSSAGNGVSAGPTGLPWIDSNGWAVRMACALAPEKTHWVSCEWPKDEPPPAPEAYQLAAADAAAHGGRWLITLDPALRAGLAAGKPEALASWGSIVSTVAFFEKHKEWRSLQPLAATGVISNFSGGDEFLGTELLNLLARRQVGYRVLAAARVSRDSLAGLAAVLYASKAPPAGGLLERLTAFARDGGLLILPASAAAVAPAGDPVPGAYPRYELRKCGRGRVAVAAAEWDDPYVVARDAHLLLSRRHDMVHLFNASAMNFYATAPAGGSPAVIHLLNYSMRPPGSALTLAVRKRYSEARMWTPRGAPVPLKLLREGGWLEMPLPPFPVYAAIELGA